jgi:hypothetical protein
MVRVRVRNFATVIAFNGHALGIKVLAVFSVLPFPSV